MSETEKATTAAIDNKGQLKNRAQIREILPHREPMLLLDDIMESNDTAIGHYTVKGDEYFLQGHFPGNPIVPGVILCEIIAQSACILMEDVMTKGQIPVYTGMDKVRFRRPVKPGDTIETTCRIKRAKHPFYFAEGSACVDGELCMQADFSFAVTSAEG